MRVTESRLSSRQNLLKVHRELKVTAAVVFGFTRLFARTIYTYMCVTVKVELPCAESNFLTVKVNSLITPLMEIVLHTATNCNVLGNVQFKEKIISIYYLLEPAELQLYNFGEQNVSVAVYAHFGLNI